jgi:threonine synthase
VPFICSRCGGEEDSSPCGVCGGIVIHRTNVKLSRYEEIIDNRFSGLWRYSILLPEVPEPWRVNLAEGGTALLKAERLGLRLGIREVYLKNETANPSGSFIDRGVALEISYAGSRGYRRIACFSRGNLGVSAAAYGAKAGFETKIYVPPSIERGKLYLLLAYDAQVIFAERMKRPEVMRLHREGYYIVDSTNPYFLSGLKTLAYELAFQQTPQYVVFPVGEGGNLSMFWEGLRDLREAGVLDIRPRLVAVQSEGCMPIVRAYNRGGKPIWTEPIKTVFGDIAVPRPPLGELALQALKESKGIAVGVSDGEILEATRDLARMEGLLAEPAAASTVAALKKLSDEGLVDADDCVVCVITGTGLKEPYLGGPIGRAARSIAARARASSRIGVTKSRILEFLSEKSLHGYGLREALASRYGIKISTASIYQHLTELADAGLVTCIPVRNNGRVRIQYELTPSGRQILQRPENRSYLMGN